MKVENDMLHPHRAPKTIAAVHDISCYGRCSMQAVWPVLSHYGHLVCPLPTALLSTHTGGFDHFTFLDLGGEMKKILASWREEGLRFDAVYSGFLGSAGQIGTVLSLIEDQPGALVLVDPVMGDCGEIYKTYTPEMCELMHRSARGRTSSPQFDRSLPARRRPLRPRAGRRGRGRAPRAAGRRLPQGRAHHRRHRRAPRRQNRRRLLGHGRATGGPSTGLRPIAAPFSPAAGTFWPPSCSPACCPGNARPTRSDRP
ncbi:MAG: hypothetical protein ACLUFV_06475 [Acutalibacteraceae bacterium]